MKAAWLLAFLGPVAVVLVLRALFLLGTDDHVAWFLTKLVLATAGGCIGGAMGARKSARRGRCRNLRLLSRQAVVRGARYGPLAALSGMGSINIGNHASSHPIHWPLVLIPVTLGWILGYLHGLGGSFLSQPEQRFAEAVEHWRAGRHSDARKALRRYLACSVKDPEREYRVGLAERFLEEENASLEMVTELEAASAPGGRGTEMEAALAPAGKGTEPESAAAPLSAERAGRAHQT